MLSHTIAEMLQELLEFDPSIVIIFNKNTRKTSIISHLFIYSTEDHIDKAIVAAWLIIQRIRTS